MFSETKIFEPTNEIQHFSEEISALALYAFIQPYASNFILAWRSELRLGALNSLTKIAISDLGSHNGLLFKPTS